MTHRGPGGQQPYPEQYPSYQPPAPYTAPGLAGSPPGRNRQRSWKGWFIASAALNVILLITTSAAASQHGPAQSAGAKTPRIPASSTPANGSTKAAKPSPSASRAKARAVAIATFTGSGIETTRKFTIGGDGTWKLDWRYSCASFGQSGNFIVTGDNGNDLNGPDVNELGKSGHGTTFAYNDPGRHYLSVNSECDWKVKVIGQR